MRRIKFAACLSILWLMAAGGLQAQTLTIAAASDLQTVLPTIAQRFEKQTGISPQLTFGSSGNFFTQLQNGAPFDVFLSADLEYPRRLVGAGQGLPDTLYEYATGRIVLWTRQDSGLDLGRGLSVLTDARVRRIAIANPAHAPYGQAAVAALRHEHLYAAAESKLVLGENISQAAQFVQSGNADVGIIALAVALAPALKSVGAYVPISTTLHSPIRQGAVVMRGSTHEQAARRFVDFLKRPETLTLLAEFGFEVRRN